MFVSRSRSIIISTLPEIIYLRISTLTICPVAAETVVEALLLGGERL